MNVWDDNKNYDVDHPGGLTCRGVLETTPNHTVKNFISLSSPQGGQFGGNSYIRYTRGAVPDIHMALCVSNLLFIILDTMYLNYSFLLPNFTKEHMYT